MRLAPGVLAVLAAVVLPWTTGGRRAPLFEGASDAPGLVFTVAGLLLLAVLIAHWDGWLAAFVGWAALGATWAPLEAQAVQVAVLVALGAFMLGAVRAWSPPARQLARWALIVVGLGEVGYQLLQRAGTDVLWPGRPFTDGRLPGTFGSPVWLGAFLAVTGALAPVELVAVFGLGLWLAQAKLGLLALAAGLLWRWRAPGLVPAGLLSALGAAWLLATSSWDSLHARLAIWRLSARLWLQAPILGSGPGSFFEAMPIAQFSAHVFPQEQFRRAHSEPVQLAVEGGLVGVALLVGWLWAHRAGFSGEYGGALVALGVVSLGMFPFRVAPVATTALVVLGLATAAPEPA